MPRQVFTAGEILTAANMNDLSDATVMVFDDSAARGSAIPSPSEGMVTYLKDTDAVEKYTTDWEPVNTQGILQVVSTIKTDTFTSTSTSFTDVTGLSATITPFSTSSKVLVMASVSSGNSTDETRGFRLMRDSTAIAVGGAAGSRTRTTIAQYFGGNSVSFHMNTSTAQVLDSPNTAAAVTYKVQGSTNSGTFTVNRSSTDPDSAGGRRTVSTITLMEVAG